MLDRLRARLSFANVVSLTALFVALGGTSYAVVALEDDSVKSRHIKDAQVKRDDLRRNSVDTTKVVQGSLRASDFAPGQAPQGPQGPPGTAVAYAHVYAHGAVDRAQSKGVTDANVSRPQPGIICFRDLPFTPRNVVASPDAYNNAGDVATSVYPSSGPCAGAQAAIQGGGGHFFVLFN
jgi:hypothetical protein